MERKERKCRLKIIWDTKQLVREGWGGPNKYGDCCSDLYDIA